MNKFHIPQQFSVFITVQIYLFVFQTLNKSTKVQDISGQHSMSVFDLLVMALQYLKNHVMRAVNRFSDTYNEDDAYFVLLVPAIFDDRAKWLMREVALKVNKIQKSVRLLKNHIL
jgi:hypothetical protein